MEHMIRGLSFLMIPIIVSGVLAFLKQPKKAENGKVHFPKFFIIFGLICSTVFLIPTIITAFLDEPIWIPILFLALSILGAVFIVAYVNCRITYDENEFTAKGFWGVRRTYTYDQVTAIRENLHEVYLYVGKRRILIDAYAIGGKEFVAHVKKRYRTLHNGEAIPKIQASGRDPFHGNIHNPGEFLFAYVLGSVVIVGFSVFLVWMIFFNPSTADNTPRQEIAFTVCDAVDGEVALTASDGKLYKIENADADFETEAIKGVCDGQTVLTVYAEEVTPDDADAYYSVKSILYGDAALVSFEETNRWYREASWPILLFPLVLAILWAGVIVGSIIVGRNPDRYKPWVVGLFFKPGYVKK